MRLIARLRYLTLPWLMVLQDLDQTPAISEPAGSEHYAYLTARFPDNKVKIMKRTLHIICASLALLAAFSFLSSPVPVSYTHLDVYKRQHPNLHL